MSTGVKLIDAVRDGDEFEKLFEKGVIVPLRVTGTSMLPLLRPGKSIVWLEGIGEKVRRGDILLFRRKNGAFVLHRVRKILPDGKLVMNGDAQSWCEVIGRESVKAVARRIDIGKISFRADGFLMTLYRLLWTPTYPVRGTLLRFAARVKRTFQSPAKEKQNEK